MATSPRRRPPTLLTQLTPQNGEDVLEIIMSRYEKKSTLVTSNRIISDWDKMLGDATLSSAVLDRLIHHCNLLKFEGPSYRLRDAGQKLNGGAEAKAS